MADMYVCVSLQSEWFVQGLTSPPGVAPLSSWGRTGIPIVL